MFNFPLTKSSQQRKTARKGRNQLTFSGGGQNDVNLLLWLTNTYIFQNFRVGAIARLPPSGCGAAARHCKTPMKSNIVSIGSYVSLFLLDFSKTKIAWWNSIC